MAEQTRRSYRVGGWYLVVPLAIGTAVGNAGSDWVPQLLGSQATLFSRLAAGIICGFLAGVFSSVTMNVLALVFSRRGR